MSRSSGTIKVCVQKKMDLSEAHAFPTAFTSHGFSYTVVSYYMNMSINLNLTHEYEHQSEDSKE